ncbi:hypothetical protein BURMUCF2_A2075 [Burkholderia multivorans CF2]|nr:hypothetical protein BURMUCF2_A2075 [Burkholderia multivorans CF2]
MHDPPAGCAGACRSSAPIVSTTGRVMPERAAPASRVRLLSSRVR